MEYNTIIEILKNNGYKPYLTRAFILVNTGIKHKDVILEITDSNPNQILFKIIFVENLFKPIYKGIISSKEELESIIISNLKNLN
jgi:hypothetical protein